MSEERKTRKPAAKRQDTSLTFRLNPLLVEQLDALVPLFEREPAALAGATANRSAVARACLTYGVSHYLRKLRDEAPPRRTAKVETPAAPLEAMSPSQAVIAAALMESDRLAAPEPETPPDPIVSDLATAERELSEAREALARARMKGGDFETAVQRVAAAKARVTALSSVTP